MSLTLRRAVSSDLEICAAMCSNAFTSVAEKHGFPSDFPTSDSAAGLLSILLNHPGFYSVVAEMDGRIVGSNFLDERASVFGVGPLSVDPAVQDQGVGRVLMQDVLSRAAKLDATSVRLMQAAYHGRSLSLYAKLGFHVRDVLACVQGVPPRSEIAGRQVRRATTADLGDCTAICRLVHGYDRARELQDALTQETAVVVEYDGRISGYATELAFGGHAVGRGTDDLKALISSAAAFGGPGILVPATNAELLGWCLDQGLIVVQTMTLMSHGMYHMPQGAYLPSILQ